MDLYIDCENLKSFIHSKHDNDFNDCLRMIRRQLHLCYNIDKSIFESDPELSDWLSSMSVDRGNSEETDTFINEQFPSRPIKSNSYINWDRKELSSIYLIDDVDTAKLKNKGCVLVADVGEEKMVLLRLFCGKDYDYHYLYDLQKNFHSWEQLLDDRQVLPCTDIIINDRYLFKEDVNLVNYNLSHLLDVLVDGVKNKINLVFFTFYDPLMNFGPDEAKKIIKKSIETKTGIKPDITFVTSNDKSKIIHDRFIITNYRLIRSGDSFIYFNTSGGKITNGGSIDIDSLASHNTTIFVDNLINKLQHSYNDIFNKNKDMIIGRQISNFITFNSPISQNKQ